MFNLDAITNENNKDNNKKWSYRMLLIGPSGSGKTNGLLNLIQKEDNESLVDKIYLYAKDLSELIKKREDTAIKNLDDQSTFIEYSNTADDVYNNIDDYNPKRKRKVLIVSDDMIADIMANKRFQAIIKELFIRCRKLNISLVFITQFYFRVPKEVRLNSRHYLIIKTRDRREFQNIAFNHSAHIDYERPEDLRSCTKESFSFLNIDTTLPGDDPMRFRHNFSDFPL